MFVWSQKGKKFKNFQQDGWKIIDIGVRFVTD